MEVRIVAPVRVPVGTAQEAVAEILPEAYQKVSGNGELPYESRASTCLARVRSWADPAMQ
jgi:uncharacterized protein YidB (DUF937 family)